MTYDTLSLQHCPLFKGIELEQLNSLIHCLGASTKTYEPDQYLFHAGDTINHIGIVLEGRLELLKETLAGNHTLISFLLPHHLFAEGIVCTSKRVAPVSLRTVEASTILFIPYERIIKSCGNACTFHVQLIHNMMVILGNKNFMLSQKIDFLMLKGIQEKLITYLLSESQKRNTTSFEIQLNRTELAAFLNVSRPSMCRELTILKNDGLLDYYQNSFKLIDIEGLQNKLML